MYGLYALYALNNGDASYGDSGPAKYGEASAGAATNGEATAGAAKSGAAWTTGLAIAWFTVCALYDDA